MKLFGAVWCRSVGLSHYFVLVQSFYDFQFLVPITSLHGKFLSRFTYFVMKNSICLCRFTLLHLSLISLSFYDGVWVAGCYYSITVRRFWIRIASCWASF